MSTTPGADMLRVLVADAIRAPSSHNTQPWRFHVTTNTIELHADRGRALPVNDPHDRELTISCGAALCNLLVSARHHGWDTRIDTRPGGDTNHLATATITGPASTVDDDLWPAIARRRTVRKAFTNQAIPDDLIATLAAAAAREGAWTETVSGNQRARLAALVAQGDALQFANPAWRRELAAWMHTRRAGDGLVVPRLGAALTRLVVSHSNLGTRIGKRDAALTNTAPLVMVIGTSIDDERAWLTAGRALQRLLLTAVTVGIQAGFANQPCQVSTLRPVLEDLLERQHPQLVLRLGFPPSLPSPTPRRDPAVVLTVAATRITPDATTP